MRTYKKLFYKGNSPWVSTLLNNIFPHFSAYDNSRSISYSSCIIDIEIKNNIIIGKYQEKKNNDVIYPEIKFPILREKDIIEELINKYPYLLKHFKESYVQDGFTKGFNGNSSKIIPDWNDLYINCSCGKFDYLNPCKHIVGLFVYLMNYLDNKPEKLLYFQGIDIERNIKLIEKISFFDDFSSEHHISNIESQVNLIEKSDLIIKEEKINIKQDIINETEIESIIKTRIGQSKFKENLLSIYKKCILCNIDIKELLIASHIKPWSESNNNERLDINNGLLLCPIHDKLFDLGYITFNDIGDIIISNRITDSMYNELKLSLQLKININNKMKEYINWHNANIYK